MRNLLRVRFVRDVAITSGAQVAQAAAAMVAGILVARFLGASAKGTLSVLVALGTMAVFIASLGVHTSGIYFFGRFSPERDRVVSNTVVFGMVGGILAGTALALTGVLLEQLLLPGVGLGLFLLYIGAVPCAYFNMFGRWLLFGAGRIGISNVPDIFGGAALLVGTVVAIAMFGDRLVPLVALQIIIEVTTSVFVILTIRRLIGLRLSISLPLLRQQMRYGVRNYASAMSWLLLIRSDVVLCNYFLGSGSTGVYSVAMSLGVPVTMFATVVGAVTFQRASSEANRETRIANTNRAFRVLVPVSGVAMIVMGLTAEWIVRLLYGNAFVDAADALLLLLPGLVAMSLQTVLINFLAGEGSPPIVYRAPILGLSMNLAANLVVIPRWGINGASATSSFAYMIVFLLMLVHYLRSTGSRVREVLVFRARDLTSLGGSEQGPRRDAQNTSHPA